MLLAISRFLQRNLLKSEEIDPPVDILSTLQVRKRCLKRPLAVLGTRNIVELHSSFRVGNQSSSNEFKAH